MLLAGTSSLNRGPNQSKYSVYGRSGSTSASIPIAQAVSYVQARATFFTVYPPPPRRTSGTFCCRRNCTQAACPCIVRLKQPSLSPARESAPHWRTTAEGRNTSMILAITWGICSRRESSA
ncbi:unnamed protein product [Mycena citricolor]|uniref:Uncharacterized protein n=1 Tax=Mycena citricolor TaxID=2018698 RepID=A0AAD2HTP8_9AGAR|nr:unnamed protein product [Mycena citricolor]